MDAKQDAVVEARRAKRDIAVIVAITGVVGFAAGLVRVSHQHAVETAQVLAGIVAYPADNPFYVYHLKLWNLGSQVAALALRLGIPERVLSIVVSGLLGAVSFQALGLCARAAGADRWLAIVLPAWIFATATFFLGLVYDILLLGTTHTYGVIGLGHALLALAAVALHRAGGLFLLGVAPAVHPSLGSWALGVGVLALLLGGKESRAGLRADARFLALGLAVAAASLGGQLWLGPERVSAETPAQDLAMRAFIRNWDFHRRPVPLYERVIFLTVAFLAIAAAWLRVRRLRDLLSPHAVVMLRMVGISAALSLALCVATRWQDRLPFVFSVVMPGRLLNLSSLALAPLLLGLLGARAQRPLGSFLLLAVAIVSGLAALLTALRTPIWQLYVVVGAVAALTAWQLVWRAPPGRLLRRSGALAYWLALATLAGVAIARLRPDPAILFALVAIAAAVVLVLDPPTRLVAWLRRAGYVRSAGALLLAAATALGAVRAVQLRGTPLNWLGDRANDPFYAAIAERPGVLLTAADLSLIQLRTRRPILLDGSGLDGLPYAPESAPHVERILRRVYGERLFDPSNEIRDVRPGALLPTSGALLWQARDAGEWTRLASEFGFTDVVTPAEWELALPRVAANPRYILYRLPDSREGDGAVAP